MAEIHFTPRLADLLWANRGACERLTGVLENIFRVLSTDRMTHLGGVPLHNGAFAHGGSTLPPTRTSVVILGRLSADLDGFIPELGAAGPIEEDPRP